MGWPIIYSDAQSNNNWEGFMAIIAEILISQVIGWLIRKYNKNKSIYNGIFKSIIVTGVICLLYLIVTLIFSPNMYEKYNTWDIIGLVLFAPPVLAGLAVIPSILVGIGVYIYGQLKMKSNPMRILIIREVRAAKKVDLNLAVSTNSDKVIIKTVNGTEEIIYSEYGYANIDYDRKKILDKDIIKTCLGKNYKLIDGYIIKVNDEKLGAKIKKAEYKPW